MRTFDLTPFHRSTIGFDRLFSLLDQAHGSDAQATSYPPYNIERTAENAYRISIAVAGFGESDITIEAAANALTVKGELQIWPVSTHTITVNVDLLLINSDVSRTGGLQLCCCSLSVHVLALCVAYSSASQADRVGRLGVDRDVPGVAGPNRRGRGRDMAGQIVSPVHGGLRRGSPGRRSKPHCLARSHDCIEHLFLAHRFVNALDDNRDICPIDVWRVRRSSRSCHPVESQKRGADGNPT